MGNVFLQFIICFTVFITFNTHKNNNCIIFKRQEARKQHSQKILVKKTTIFNIYMKMICLTIQFDTKIDNCQLFLAL